MSAPQLLPMLKPFREAVEWQLGRVPMTRKEFDELSHAAKLRAFTIAGLTKRALLEEAHQLAFDAIAKNLTKDEFAERLGAILDKQDGLLLDYRRIELIARNNTATAYSAGRYAQLAHPDVVKDRPYWRYPLGPDDSRTSPVCRKLQGFIARYDDPVWQHVFPPNHHNERHIQVTSLTTEQAEATGKIYESGPEGRIGPWIDGQEILPDPGFDRAPGSLISADDEQLLRAARAKAAPLKQKGFADYGLPGFREVVAESELPALPELGARVNPARLDDPAEYEAAWEHFRNSLDMAPGESAAVIVDAAGDGAQLTRATFDHLVGLDGELADRLRKHDRPEYFSLIRPAIEDPLEIWMAPYVDANGRVTWRRRYFAAFVRRDDGAKAVQLFMEEGADGWIFESTFVTDPARMDRNRHGLLIYRKGGAQ